MLMLNEKYIYQRVKSEEFIDFTICIAQGPNKCYAETL